jgi:hypothetical protein
VSESSKKSVDQKVKLNVEGFYGFESGSESEEEGEEKTSEVELKYYAQQKDMVQRVMSNYVDQIVSNLEDRFVESDQVSKFGIFVLNLTRLLFTLLLTLTTTFETIKTFNIQLHLLVN